MKTILTNYTGICAICGAEATCGHHMIYGSLHKLADKDKLILPMCVNCHNLSEKSVDRIHGNSMAESLSKIAGQLAWEKEFYRKEQEDKARQEFIKRYGKSFL